MNIDDFTPKIGHLDQTAADARRALAQFGRAERQGPPFLLPLDHFSASSLAMAESCPEQWRQRYVLGRKVPPAQALVLGQATHRGIEFGLDTKLYTQQDPDLDLMIEWYHDSVWPEVLDSYGGPGEIIWDDSQDEVRAKGAQMVGAYHPTISRLEPEAVEFEFRLAADFPVPVIGRIDLVQANGRPTVDVKTSKAKVNKPKDDWRVQGRVYQLVVPRPVDFHVITKTKFPGIHTGLDSEELIEPYFEQRAWATKRRINTVLEELNFYFTTIGPDDYWPTRGINSWRCGWCGYREACPEWSDPQHLPWSYPDPFADELAEEVFRRKP